MNPLDKISGTIVTGLVISVVIAVGTSLAGAIAATSLVIWLQIGRAHV